jgi:hypothetical protein
MSNNINTSTRFTGLGTTIPFARPLRTLTQQELFEESSRISVLLDNLSQCIRDLLASGNDGDFELATQLQTYKITQESKLVQVQQQILATRR